MEVRLLIFSRVTALTVIGSSRPRGPGFQATLGRVGIVPFVPFFVDAISIGVAGGDAIDVTPAQVDGGVGLGLFGSLSTSFSHLKMSLRFMTRTPVLYSSRTIGGPSRIVTRRVIDSSRRTSSKKGAYPASWETPSRICLQL